MKTTLIYAVYLPGSSSPDYIGSHLASPPDNRLSALKWRYTRCIYLGQGCWVNKDDGHIESMPALNYTTPWGAQLLSMSPAQRLALRIDTLAVVDASHRWQAEALALRTHKPPFNAMLPQTLDAKRRKLNAYHNVYRVGYYKANPDKAQAKRDKDRARIAAKRAQAKRDKQAKEAAQPSPVA